MPATPKKARPRKTPVGSPEKAQGKPSVEDPRKDSPKPANALETAVAKPKFGKNQPSQYCGKPGRSGPPKGNRNGMRHGLKAGKLPKGAKYIEHQLNALRRTLEDAVTVSRGEVTLSDAAAIQTACKWERHGALALRWLRLEEENLKPTERLQFSREIARASTERDKALDSLDLKGVAAPWLEVESEPAKED